MSRRRPCVQEGCLYSPMVQDGPVSRWNVPVMTLVLIYFLHLLDHCHSNSFAEESRDNETLSPSITTASSVQMIDSTKIESNNIMEEFSDQSYHGSAAAMNGSDSAMNDIVTRFNITQETDLQDPDENTSYPNSYTTNETSSLTVTTDIPTPSTRRPIYHRGHRLGHSQPEQRTFHPAKDEEGVFRAPNSIRLTRVENFREEPDGANSRKKRKHSTTKERFYNYKMLYDTFKGQDPKRKRTEFYAWIFGAAMLGLGSITTVTSCFVFCFCSEKVRKRRRLERARHGSDKAGEYQRVESVSSMVDHAGGEHSELYGEHSELYEEQMDSVTII